MALSRALVLDRRHELALLDIVLPQAVGPGEVRVQIHTVGVCGSDVHYYTHGRIGLFVLNAPMHYGGDRSTGRGCARVIVICGPGQCTRSRKPSTSEH